MYGLPYLVVNFWLVLYTLLHHTSESVPRYDSDTWEFVKGALCTIDRPQGYGAVINSMHHEIGSTHVVHHLFSRLPHFNAAEASQILSTYLVKKYPGVYRKDDSWFLRAFFEAFGLSSAMEFRPERGLWTFASRRNEQFTDAQ